MKKSTKQEESQSAVVIFGGFDGLTSSLGVVLPLMSKPTHTIVAAVLGLALASAIGMGAGDWLGGAKPINSVFIGLATLLGTVLPLVPRLFVRGWLSSALTLAIVVAVGVAISISRAKTRSIGRALVETFVVLGLASGAALLVGALAGVS